MSMSTYGLLFTIQYENKKKTVEEPTKNTILRRVFSRDSN